MKEIWAVLYLHDWDPDNKIYPEIHAVYCTWQEAEAAVSNMIDPKKYWVRKARFI